MYCWSFGPAQAWLLLAEEAGKSPPPLWMLKKALGMKSSQARGRT